MARYVLIDRRFGRLCEYLDFTHGETEDLFWVDVTARPAITLEWSWADGELIAPKPKLEPIMVGAPIDCGPQVYVLDAGKGLPAHQHPFAHDHVVESGRTLVIVAGQEPRQYGPGDRTVLLAGILHSIIALENETRFANTRLIV